MKHMGFLKLVSLLCYHNHPMHHYNCMHVYDEIFQRTIRRMEFVLQQTDTFVNHEAPHTYDYPLMDLNHLETNPNEAYATVVHQS